MAKNKYGEKKNCFILKWAELPKKLRDDIKEWDKFSNDVFLNMPSEFKPKELGNGLGMANIERYWRDQAEANGFNGPLEQFIIGYGLQLEVWVSEQNFDLADVDMILIEVCW